MRRRVRKSKVQVLTTVQARVASTVTFLLWPDDLVLVCDASLAGQSN